MICRLTVVNLHPYIPVTTGSLFYYRILEPFLCKKWLFHCRNPGKTFDQLFVPSFRTQELKWSLSPQTPISWLNVYMQVAYLKETDDLLIPKYPQATFTQIAEVSCDYMSAG